MAEHQLNTVQRNTVGHVERKQIAVCFLCFYCGMNEATSKVDSRRKVSAPTQRHKGINLIATRTGLAAQQQLNRKPWATYQNSYEWSSGSTFMGQCINVHETLEFIVPLGSPGIIIRWSSSNPLPRDPMAIVSTCSKSSNIYPGPKLGRVRTKSTRPKQQLWKYF